MMTPERLASITMVKQALHEKDAYNWAMPVGGAAAGGLAGAGIGYLGSPAGGTEEDSRNARRKALRGALVGALVGGGIGGMLGVDKVDQVSQRIPPETSGAKELPVGPAGSVPGAVATPIELINSGIDYVTPDSAAGLGTLAGVEGAAGGLLVSPKTQVPIRKYLLEDAIERNKGNAERLSKLQYEPGPRGSGQALRAEADKILKQRSADPHLRLALNNKLTGDLEATLNQMSLTHPDVAKKMVSDFAGLVRGDQEAIKYWLKSDPGKAFAKSLAGSSKAGSNRLIEKARQYLLTQSADDLYRHAAKINHIDLKLQGGIPKRIGPVDRVKGMRYSKLQGGLGGIALVHAFLNAMKAGKQLGD